MNGRKLGTGKTMTLARKGVPLDEKDPVRYLKVVWHVDPEKARALYEEYWDHRRRNGPRWWSDADLISGITQMELDHEYQTHKRNGTKHDGKRT